MRSSIDQVGEERACGCVCHQGHTRAFRPWLTGSHVDWISLLDGEMKLPHLTISFMCACHPASTYKKGMFLACNSPKSKVVLANVSMHMYREGLNFLSTGQRSLLEMENACLYCCVVMMSSVTLSQSWESWKAVRDKERNALLGVWT